ncbi:MAG: glutamine synthetase type III, partial [Pleurocapsa sp.]
AGSNSTQGFLRDPGDDRHENIQFLVFCAAVMRGVHKFGPLLRAVVATASNDHRLGANEAPPAIISVYLGTQLEDVFEQIQKGDLTGFIPNGVMDFGVPTLPSFVKDSGDRNRTSPFAFTGNRFEFRAVGSNQSVAGPLIAMNTILADSLDWIANKLESQISAGTELEAAIFGVFKEIMDDHGAVVFGGDGYSEEWHKMAVEERGLLNLPTTADALPYLKDKSIEELFEKTGVLSPTELESRFEVYAEQYILSIEVEANLVVDMAKTLIYPAAVKYVTELASAISGFKELGIDFNLKIAKKSGELTNKIVDLTDELSIALEKEEFESTEEHMQYFAPTIRPLMDKIRVCADTLEGELADELWPLPKYQEMWFIK